MYQFLPMGVKFDYLILNQILKLLIKKFEKTQNMILNVHDKASNLAVHYTFYMNFELFQWLSNYID